jgi:hypothetical protein
MLMSLLMSDPLDDHQNPTPLETLGRSWLKVVLVDLVEWGG